MKDESITERLRALPSVDRLANAIARAELAARRQELLDGDRDEVDLVQRARVRLGSRPGRVLNATGVVLHTNLGRAPLATAAQAAIASVAAGYSALELELSSGERSPRGRRAQQLLVALTGAQAALAVNNGAAAVLLAAASLAGGGREVIVSRGELVEIGGGFRIADVVAQSGATLVEVGSTNRTTARDYAAAIGPATGAILRVHQSNFKITGFVGRPALEELVALDVPVIDDLGSGAVDPSHGALAGEPTARESVAAGAALSCFSADKLLGGPQAGILVGGAGEIEACRRHPLARALRIDKLSLAGLEATLELHLRRGSEESQVPVLAMLEMDRDELERRTARLAELTGGEIVEVSTPVGGGSLPSLELSGPAVRLDAGPAGAEQLARALRLGSPPVIGRIQRDHVLLSARTLLVDEIEIAAEAVARARAS
ncbi:MAG: L-seryl-tRNA(Sec) selenium transferase [Solirubrobacteraceae bacterium]